MSERYTSEVMPQVGDHVSLRGTTISGDVRVVDGYTDRPSVTFKVRTIAGKSATSKAARALRGTWITCLPELLTMRVPAAQDAADGVASVPAMLQAHVERLVSEFAPQYSREQIQRTVSDSLRRYADARVTTYVPLLVYRDVRAALAGHPERAR